MVRKRVCYMDREITEKYVHFTMAIMGGFLGAYTLLNYHDLFGNAQTVNMITMAMDIVGHNLGDFLLRLLDFGVYILGFVVTVLLARNTTINLHICSILINMVVSIGVCLIPEETNDFIALCPILFATAFQWNSFKGADGFVCSTIFSTNNLRQFTTAVTSYLCDKEEEQKRKAKFFGGVLACYHIGVAISFLMYLHFKRTGAWICVVPAIFAIILECQEKGKKSFPKWKCKNGVQHAQKQG